MRTIIGFVIAAAVVALGGGVALAVAGFEREMASAEEHLATLRYEEAAERLESARDYAQYARWLPGVGARASRDLRAQQASLHYWQRQYGDLLPRAADPVGAVEGEDVELQLLVANGAYRAGQSRSTDRDSTITELNEAIGGYLSVLKNGSWDERAAYNYEYLVRLRDELSRGRRKVAPPREEGNASLGAVGAPERSPDMQQFEVYIPLESEERAKASEAGKAAPNARKG